MMMWVIFLMIAWRVNGFLLFLHADGNTDNFLVNTNNSLTCAIYGSYMSYLWQLRGQPGNMASSFYNHYILFLVL